MPVHTVQQGEYLAGIAETYGFRTIDPIWNHANNAELKNTRKNPEVLFPGDQVFIPEKDISTQTRGTGQIHKFQAPGQKLKLRLKLLDINDRPRTAISCTLTIDGDATTLTTDGDGCIERVIPKTAKEGKLTLPDLEVPLKVGHLDPVDKQSGQIGRLNNLGYEAGDPNSPDPDQFRSAVEEFQCDEKLPVTGDCDDTTQTKLLAVHGT